MRPESEYLQETRERYRSVQREFSDKNVGAGKTVTLTSSASGADVNNYAFTHQTSTTADITAKPVTVTGITSNKVYDGLIGATVDVSGIDETGIGILAGDTGTVTISATGVFSERRTGMKTVTLTSSASGADVNTMLSLIRQAPRQI